MHTLRLRALALHSVFLLPVLLLTGFCCLTSCSGGSSTTTTTTTTSSTTNPYAAVYKNVTWASGVTVSFPSSCSMTVTATGYPPFHNDYYLTPANGKTVYATTPSGIQLTVSPYTGTGLSTVDPISATFNICPTKATATTATGGGAIGVITSGEVLFDSYEATSTVALADDASYSGPATNNETAYFVDQCSSHTTAGMGGGSTWHYHGNPVCYTPSVDGASGPSHIIGIALDGFPIYGGRDINGNIIDPSTLDACNGISSATPEFPGGAYHYVLPLNSDGTVVTTKQSSIECYAGTVGATLSAQMQKLACNMSGVQMAHNMPMIYAKAAKRTEMAALRTQTATHRQRGL